MNQYKLKFRKNSFTYIPFTICIVLIMTLMLTLPAYAHRVISYSYVEGNKIVVEGAFDDGSPTKEAKIRVYDSSGKVVHKGKTNGQGIYKFKVPKKDDLKIVLEAGMGHKSESTIKKSDLPGVETTKQQVESTQQQQTESAQHEKTQAKSSEESDVKSVGISEEKLRTIIREEVASELSKQLPSEITPIKRSLIQLKNKKGPGVTEILGGIGYIFGLMGIAFYFKAKKE